MSKSKSSAAAKAPSEAPESVAADYAPEFVEDEPGGREAPSGTDLAVVSPDEEFGVDAIDVPADLSLPVAELESIAPVEQPTAKEIEEGGGDSMLARYFREMATHAVMGPEEELATAIEVEDAEIDHWVQILSYAPSAEYALASLEADLPKEGGTRRRRADAADPGASQAPEELQEAAEQADAPARVALEERSPRALARAIRLADSDRLWVLHAEDVVRKLGAEPDTENDEEGSSTSRIRKGTPCAWRRRRGRRSRRRLSTSAASRRSPRPPRAPSS